MRKSIKIFLMFLLLTGVFNAVGQNEDFGESRLFYRSNVSGGAGLHTRGFDAGIRRGYRIDGYRNFLMSMELSTMKHYKEVKQLAQEIGTLKRYTYGKLNSLFIVRPSFGMQKILFTKDAKKGVEIAYNWMVGASLGLVKPIYLIIADPSISTPNYERSTVAYDPEKHYPGNIVGKASYFRGISDMKVYPGLHAKFGFMFEFAPDDELIRSVETGVAIDAYHKKVPMMAYATNQQVFLTYYLNFYIGKKYI